MSTVNSFGAKNTLTVVSRQLAGSVPDDATPETVVIAYEPVWAIGTGLTPTTNDIAEWYMQAAIGSDGSSR